MGSATWVWMTCPPWWWLSRGRFCTYFLDGCEWHAFHDDNNNLHDSFMIIVDCIWHGLRRDLLCLGQNAWKFFRCYHLISWLLFLKKYIQHNSGEESKGKRPWEGAGQDALPAGGWKVLVTSPSMIIVPGRKAWRKNRKGCEICKILHLPWN